jgi:hypothetical protein
MSRFTIHAAAAAAIAAAAAVLLLCLLLLLLQFWGCIMGNIRTAWTSSTRLLDYAAHDALQR